MKIGIFSKSEVKPELKEDIEKYGFQYSEKKPNIIISIGGDGTYLRSERKWPGIPKLIVKDSSVCVKCETDDLGKALEKIKKKDYKIKENIKLETNIKRKKLKCVNEFSFRNRYATTALRFYLWVNGDRTDEIIGDGLIFATPFGSTAYYKSVGGEEFEKGIGIGFNNPTVRMKDLVVKEDSKIEFKINRGDAVFNADNNPRIISLENGDIIRVKKSKEVSKIVDI
ncbi:MAG: hypothetical protein GF368_01605 [Candidatus Aenigmarchaeota archaeon]|nr:hypothetical protein [Candidatus Aenigmarchaeota archaeon]